jgi:hypothetical protein
MLISKLLRGALLYQRTSGRSLLQTFQLNPEGFASVAEQIRLRTIAFMILAGLIALSVLSYNFISRGESPLIVLFASVFTAVLMAFVARTTIRNTIAKQRESWSSFRLIWQGDTITRRQTGLPDVSINKSDAPRIWETSQCLCIKAGNKVIAVSRHLDGYDQLHMLIAEWIPIGQSRNQDTATTSTVKVMAIAVASIAVYLVALYVNEKIFAIPLCLIVVGGFLYSIVATVRSTEVTAEVKRGAFFVIIPLLPVILKLFFLLK